MIWATSSICISFIFDIINLIEEVIIFVCESDFNALLFGKENEFISLYGLKERIDNDRKFFVQETSLLTLE